MTAPFPKRLYWWLDQRFPPVVYTLLVGLFFASAQLVAVQLGGTGSLDPLAAVVAWCFFLHLRIFDEHKDYDADIVAYPDRVLSKGLVTLGHLRWLAAAAIVVQLCGALWMGQSAVLWWAFAFAFSVAMFFEFGFSAWLSEHMVVYAVTHNPVTVFVAMFVWAATGAPWHWGFVWYLALATFGMLSFEFARKTRLPAEEHKGVPSYSSVLGQGPARQMLAVTYLAVGVSLTGLAWAMGASVPLSLGVGIGCAAPGLLSCMGMQKAKIVEGAASVVLLSTFIVSGGLAWSLS